MSPTGEPEASSEGPELGGLGGDDPQARAGARLWDGRYLQLRSLGAGGMGVVAMAEDTLQPGRVVALKRLLPAHVGRVPAFLREFRIHRQLAHPNIPRAFELGFAEDQGVLCPYMTLELSPGVGLHELLARHERGLPLRVVSSIAAGLLRALDHIHRQGFVHADLKPSNVLVFERHGALEPHLIDFGVAVPRGRSLGDELVTTPEYAAPELLEGALVDPRVDLYALGLVLYELIEHRRPWSGSDVDALWAARSRSGPPPLTATGCPPAMAELVCRLLSPKPAQRPSSAAEVLSALVAATGWEAEIEPVECFVQRLLTVPLPWRGWLERIAAEITADHVGGAAEWAIVIDVPAGFFARRLLGPVLDEAAARRSRVVPVRFDAEPGRGPHPLLGYLERLAATAEGGKPRADDARPLVFVIENLDAADPASLAALAKVAGEHARVVATRRAGATALPELLMEDSPSGPRPRPGVRVTALAPWTEADVRAWLHRALGRIGAPWERADLPLPLPLTPAGLVEALATLHREGHLTRAGDGYAWRERGRAMRPAGEALSANRRIESLDALLACIRAPVPEAALPAYLGVWVEHLGELLASGALLARGDGTIEVPDEPARASAYGQLTPARRAQLHRRLAQALEEVSATSHRVAEEWLLSDAPLLAVPHLLAAAEARPGRLWLTRALALVRRARALVEAETSRMRPASGERGEAGEQPRPLELWRYEALILRTEARLLLTCGELGRVAQRLVALAAIGTEVGHRHTLQVALELQVVLDLRRGAWDLLVEGAGALVTLEGERPSAEAVARLHWARAMRFAADGLPGAALTELEAGLDRLAGAAGAPRASPPTQPGLGPIGGDGADVALLLLEARAELCLASRWMELARSAIEALLVKTRTRRCGIQRARARTLEAASLRLTGRPDLALAHMEDTIAALPRERTPLVDAHAELELAAIRLELADFERALDHAHFAYALAEDDGVRGLMARAAMIEASGLWHLGAPLEAWRKAQEAVQLAAADPEVVGRDARLLTLELALAWRGFAASEEVLREATELAYRAQRRLEGARAARAFRLAAEASIIRREVGPAVELAERALAEVEAGGGDMVAAPPFLVTAARASLLAERHDEARARVAGAAARVEVLAGRIEEPTARAGWLAHPDRQLVRGLATKAPEDLAQALGGVGALSPLSGG